MRWLLATACLIGSLLVMPTMAGETEEPGVTLDQVGGMARIHVVVPGKLVDFAVEDRPDGLGSIWFLVAPFGPAALEEEEGLSDEEKERRKQLLPDCPSSDLNRGNRRLMRLQPGPAGELVELRADLPWTGSQIAFADLNGDGRESLVLIVRPVDENRLSGELPPGLYTWDGDPASPESTLTPLLEQPFLVWSRKAPGTVVAPGFGELGLYRYDAEAGRFGPDSTVPMPMDVGVRQDRIRLTAQTVVPLEVAAGHLVYATWPTPFGKTRLRTTIIDPEVAGEGQVVESWAKLPEPEDLMDANYLVLDGKPVLVVQTKTADKLALFGEKRVRMFGLEPDRSRSGFRPLLAGESGMNLWQQGTPWILDVNQDGRSDLVIGYWKGLKNSRVVLEVFLRNEDGTFQEKPRTTAFDVKDGNRTYVAYGRDLNGDELFDLMVSADERLWLYPGLRSRNGKKLVDPEPERILDLEGPDAGQGNSITISVGSGGARTTQSGFWTSAPGFLDLDGDGAVEIVFVHGGARDRPGTFTALFPNSDD